MKCNNVIALFFSQNCCSKQHRIPEHIYCIQELAFLQRNINIYLMLFISICTLTSKTDFDAPSIKKVQCRLFLSCICIFSLFFSLQIASALFVLWDICNHPPCGSRNEVTTSCSLSGGKLRWEQQGQEQSSQ